AAVAVGGVVNFNVTGVITLTSGELLINSPVSIGGPGADRLTIQRSDAQETPEFSVFEIRSAIASIYGLTNRNGYLSNSPDEYGAGILNSGFLTLRNCVVRDNRAGGRGVGLENFGSMHVINCTFANNQGIGGGSQGGAFYNYWYIELVNCTLSGNSAGGSGGGFQNDVFCNSIIDSCTIVSNSAPVAAAIYNEGFENESGVVDIRNSIVAANS